MDDDHKKRMTLDMYGCNGDKDNDDREKGMIEDNSARKGVLPKHHFWTIF